MNILELVQWKRTGRKLTMLTCYDAWSARLLSEASVDMVLVGDSAAMVMHGHEDTIPATVDMMSAHVTAVRRGAPRHFLIGDLPFMAWRRDLASAVDAVTSLMQAGANAVKLEGYDAHTQAVVERVVGSGVPVMGHIGLTPQSVHALGGFRVQGRGENAAQKLLEQARGLEAAGCFAVVLECVPESVSAEITAAVKVPTIGIGAGVHCDGQVLVLHDLLGLTAGRRAKFVRTYMDGAGEVRAAVDRFLADVAAGRFPSQTESYHD